MGNGDHMGLVVAAEACRARKWGSEREQPAGACEGGTHMGQPVAARVVKDAKERVAQACGRHPERQSYVGLKIRGETRGRGRGAVAAECQENSQASTAQIRRLKGHELSQGARVRGCGRAIGGRGAQRAGPVVGNVPDTRREQRSWSRRQGCGQW